MNCFLGIALLSAALVGPTPTNDFGFYADYKPAYEAAKADHRPLLVIINPGTDSDEPSLDIDALRRSGHRRELLEKYVVTVIDASTPAGQEIHKKFGSPALPRVSVIDKAQKWQIYRTSKSLSAEDWNLVLEKYQTGKAPAAPKPPCNCPFAAR